MRVFLATLFLWHTLALLSPSPLHAQSTTPNPIEAPSRAALLQAELDELGTELSAEALEASLAAEATATASLASPSAEVEQKIQERKDQDLTETTGQQKSKLAAYLDEHPIGELRWHNFLQHALRNAIGAGLPANIVVLILLFPLTASIIAASRHVVGLKGFGVYIPAVLSVAFVSTGIITGVAMFIAILFAASVTRQAIRRLKLPYLPRTAMLLWGVSAITLIFLVTASLFEISAVYSISIFPVLILMLLTENFMETQLARSQSEAVRLTTETLLIAVICSLIISWEMLQQLVILNPELTIIAVGIANVMIGRYTGLRLLEYLRFKNLIE